MDYAVIMAGGTGKRLWPLSRQQRPKQVLKLVHGQTLLGQCYERLAPIFSPEQILVLTNAAYVDLVRDELPNVPAGNVIAEPMVRDTAGAIGLAATVIAKDDPDAAMAVVTADQLIDPATDLQQAIQDALAFVSQRPQALVTFGIQPDRPSTQYGYIHCQSPAAVEGCVNAVYRVAAFKEKPDRDTAQSYLDRGDTFWNAGMFVWKASTIMAQLAEFLPAATTPLQAIAAAWRTDQWEATLQTAFAELPKISIDFAVMEKASDVHAIRLDCQWLDMGSFPSLLDVVKADEQGNVVGGGLGRFLDSRNNIVATEDANHMIATIGMEDVIVVHSKDATLVCPVDQAERLKELLDRLEGGGDQAFL